MGGTGVILLGNQALIGLVDGDDRRLSPRALEAMDLELGPVERGEPKASLLISAISGWTLAMRVSQGRLGWRLDLDRWLDLLAAIPAVRVGPWIRLRSWVHTAARAVSRQSHRSPGYRLRPRLGPATGQRRWQNPAPSPRSVPLVGPRHLTPCGRMAPVIPSAMAPAAVHRLGHVALRVQEMERAKAFYIALGLRLTWEADDWCYLQWPQSGEGIALLSPDYRAAGPHFAFHFQDRAAVDHAREELVARGHSCGPVHDHRDGTASFYMQDPEGNWLELLYEPAEGLPSNVGAASIPLSFPSGPA